MKTRSPIVFGVGAVLVAVTMTACAGSYMRGENSRVLTDGKGMTVYTFDKDTPGSGSSACYGGCAAKWPPVQKIGDDSAEFGSITRQDGTKQITYKGAPLYYFVGDTKPGDKSGDGLANVWHIVKVSSRSTGGGKRGYGGSGGYGGY